MRALSQWIADPLLRGSLIHDYPPDSQAIWDSQDRRLRRLVAHAYHRVPFYRRLYDNHGIHPSRFRGLEDLAALPVVERRQLQQAEAADLVAEGFPHARLVVRKTSGASGQPLEIRRSRSEDLLLQAVRLRALISLGLRPWHRRAHLTLINRVSAGGTKPLSAVMRRNGLFAFEAIDRLSHPDEVVCGIVNSKAEVLQGPAQKIAECCADGDPDLLSRIRPRFVVCGGETSTETQRRVIEEALHTPVYDFYGSHEFNLIAWQRRAGGIYEMAHSITLGEVLSRGGSVAVSAGESGEFVGTALCSFAAPLIRFRLGDDVEVEEERGGICWRLRTIHGRTTEAFITLDGLTIHAYSIVSSILKAAPWMLSYQMIQHNAGELHIRVVPRNEISQDEITRVEHELQTQFERALRITIQPVSSIPQSPSGKSHTFVRTCDA